MGSIDTHYTTRQEKRQLIFFRCNLLSRVKKKREKITKKGFVYLRGCKFVKLLEKKREIQKIKQKPQ
jgi:hypothetical protein